jgi:hypothetical protein
MTIKREYTIWCDDKRGCHGAHLSLATDTEWEARKYARLAGWSVWRGDAAGATCPDCLAAQKHIPGCQMNHHQGGDYDRDCEACMILNRIEQDRQILWDIDQVGPTP